MVELLKSMMISGTFRLGPCATIADCTDEKFVLTFTSRLTSLEMPVDATTPALSMDDVPVLMTVCWLSAVEAPVERTVAALVPEDRADDTDVTFEMTEETPTFAVESELENNNQMLFSVDTWADVEPVVVFDCAVERSVPIEVTDDRRVDSDCTRDSAELCRIDVEAATEAMVDALADWLRLVDRVVDSRVDTLVSVERSLEIALETDTAADRVAEIDRPAEVPADVIADVETTLLTSTMVLRKVEFWVDATVSRLVTVDRPVELLVSAETLLDTWLWRPWIWLSATDAPLEAAFWLVTAVETAVLSSVCWLRIVETPTFAVDSDVDRLVNADRPLET